jgi:hypothetical protein
MATKVHKNYKIQWGKQSWMFNFLLTCVLIHCYIKLKELRMEGKTCDIYCLILGRVLESKMIK